MSAKSEATFTSVACGYGVCQLKTFAVTSDGTLCCFGASCIMERLVSLEASHGNAISVTEAYVAVAGSSSIVRLFDPSTLEYRSTMPFPPPFGKANEPNEVSSNILHPDVPHRYPAVIAVRVTGSHVIVLYSDRSLFIYDVGDTQNVQVERSFMCHSGCIRDLKIAGRVRGLNGKGKLVYCSDSQLEGRRVNAKPDLVPNGTFVTCSDDNTMRLWHLDLHKQTRSSGRFHGSEGSEATDFPAWKNPFSQEMLRVVYHDGEKDFADEEGIVLGGTCSCDEIPDIHSPSQDHGPVNGLRAVAIHPDQTQVVAGDKEGNISILQLPCVDEVREIGPHSTEVHCIAFSGSDGGGKACLMASGGRDRLVHVYDCNKGHTVLSTLDNHSAAVTSLQFTRDGKKLLSCGADKTIVFSEVRPDGKVSRYNSLPFTGGKIFDMAMTSDDEYLVTSCNNRLDIHGISSCKHIKTHHVGEQHRIDICPANFCVAMSGSLSDKTIHVVDLSTGETLADATGHGEAITAVKFTPDCRRLISASSDGCVFVWRLSEEIQHAIKSRLPRVTEFQAPNPIPPPKAEPVQEEPVLPPPAPSLPAPKAIRAPQQTNPPKSRAPQDPQLPKASQPKKASESAVASATPAAKSGVSKKSEAKESTGWKSKATPVPGPMAKIPMEEWMRTRESAKKTVHVADDDALDAESADEGIQLEIDRSQTPDWAKTMKPKEAKKSVRKSPSQLGTRRLAGEKWGNRAVPQPFERECLDEDRSDVTLGGRVADGREVDEDDENDREDPLYIKQQSGEVHQLEIPRSKEISVLSTSDLPKGIQHGSPPALENVMSLSISNLDIKSHSASLASSSLALEREQLEKRKKQIETANAVAAMNSKLFQLGLLKPQKSQQAGESIHVTEETDDGGAVSPSGDESDTSDTQNGADDVFNQAPSTGANVRASIEKDAKQSKQITRADIPEEMLQSIDVSVIRRMDRDQSVEGNERDIASEVEAAAIDIRTPTVTDSVANLCAVNQSMSTFTQGFAVKNVHHADVDQSVPGVIGGVDRSLSAFSSGYAGDDALAKKPALPKSTDVASSLSAYTQGYIDGEGIADSRLKRPAVAESLSSFTTGFQVQNADRRSQDLHNPRVDESLSAFTSGFQVANMAGQGEKVAPSTDVAAGVGASISSFTSGYASDRDPREVPVNQSISLSAVTASLSHFTSGYHTDDSSTERTSLSSARDSTERQSVTGNTVAESLSMFTAGYGAERAASPVNEPPNSDRGVVAESLSVFTTGYEAAANQSESPQKNDTAGADNSRPTQQKEHDRGTDASDVSRSLSSFTAGYEVMNALPASPASSPSSIVSSASSSTPSRAKAARESSAAKSSSACTGMFPHSY